MRYIFFLFALFLVPFSWAQDLTVSDEILNELETVVVETATDTFTFRVAYPQNYSAEKEYKCFIGLSGGNQSLEIVNYCYAAWFRSGYFDDYITILPVVNTDTINFRNYNKKRIERLLNTINEEFKVKQNWLIAGTSNGGVAAFNFVAAFPTKFEGIITAPGVLSESIQPTSDWIHLKVILAYGERDEEEWKKGVKLTAKKLKKKVKWMELVPLKEQGHILPISFNVDKMFDPYFLHK